MTFSTALGKKDIMHSLVVKATLESGSFGLGECPTSAAFGNETISQMKKCFAQWARELCGMPIDLWKEKVSFLRTQRKNCPMSVSGLETALFRAFLKAGGITEHEYWGEKSHALETDITVPFVPDLQVLGKWVDYAVGRGFRIYKIKISGDLEEDMKFLSTLYIAIGDRLSHFTVRLDGNQCYDTRTFYRMIEFLQRENYGVELFEQPLPKHDFKGLKEIRRNSHVPVILDETVVTGEDMERAIDDGLCHGVNIKTAKSGIQDSLKIMNLAKKAGLKLMIGCMTETMIGLSAGIFLSAGTANFDYIDLDGIYFLRHRNVYGQIKIRSPWFFID